MKFVLVYNHLINMAEVTSLWPANDSGVHVKYRNGDSETIRSAEAVPISARRVVVDIYQKLERE